MKPHILLVDDEPATQFGFSRYLTKAGYAVQAASCLAEAQENLLSRHWDVVLLDLQLPDGNGLDWIPALREQHPALAIIAITGFGDIPIAVEAMRRGADHFLTKPVKLEELEVFLRKSVELKQLRHRQFADQRLSRKEPPYFGESPAMQKVLELATLAAESDAPVLLLGETGSGKGVLARWIHEHSHRREAPFVEVNCAGLRGELLASELFGHVRGAFTSAIQDRQGLIEIADGGTLFLDEIGDMDPMVQAQFLKVLEEKQYRRLGEVKVRQSDFWLICATNQNLLENIQQERFRQDLYFRIQVFPIQIPPLRERPQDLPGLITHLLRILGASHLLPSPALLQFLTTYSWPGNIRELRNVLERALLLARQQPLTPAHFPGLHTSSQPVELLTPITDLAQQEAAHIQAVLARYGGDTQQAAKALGISRATLYRKLKKFRNA